MNLRCICLLGSLAALGCGPGQVRPMAQQRAHPPKQIASQYLPNALQIHPKVISGGLPEGDAAFHELSELGVQTIISVDAATPDVATAKKHGLRYIHLPHGYDGIPPVSVQELAKAVRDLPGPIYIHCHHGKHRSPAAAAVACVTAGLIDPTSAALVLKTAGTSENYRGLYHAAESARRIDGKALDQLIAEFPETAAVPPLAEAMVDLEHTHDHLQQIAAAGWKAPAQHPDLDPAHEALLLREHFTELLRLDPVQSQPPSFQRLLAESQAAAQELESSLREGRSPDHISASLSKISKACADCHQRFRDIPLGQMGK